MYDFHVRHIKFGDGILTEVEDGKAIITFKDGVRKFKLAGLDKYLSFDDLDLKSMIDQATAAEAPKPIEPVKSTPSFKPSYNRFAPMKSSPRANTTNELLGPRAGNIPVSSENQMYMIIGYLSKPGRISSVEAEVPADGRDEVFERLFPGQKYRPIQLGYTPSGMVNKMNSQFRINLADITNCPEPLKSNLGAGTKSSFCVARINKSQFVMNLVMNYGFRFGDRQDFIKVRDLAIERGYLADYKRGLYL